MLYLYLAAGGVAGTIARYRVGVWAATWSASGFPWGTVIVNLAGSFILGFATRTTAAVPVSPEVRGLIAIGFCGAFTTFSTFSLDTVSLVQQGAWGRAAVYAFGSLALGLLALIAGLASASVLFRAGS